MDNFNVLNTTEERSFVNKAKEKMNAERIRQAYKEKYIDTGKSQEFEKELDEKAKRIKKRIKIAGTIATIALIFCPADGPFGEICTLLATPAFCKLVDLATDLEKKAIVSGKRSAEKYLLHVDGSNEEVEGLDLESGNIINDFRNIKKEMDNVERARYGK